MKSDAQLKKDVVEELAWEPSINATAVGVAVKDGIVTLSGHLNTYAEKNSIERAVGRVSGVRAVAVELDVKLDPDHKKSDSEIAAAAESALKWQSLLPVDRIRVKVEKGFITLSGEVDWDYQRRNAEKTVRSLIGVVGVYNTITLKPSVMPSNVEARICQALTRHAQDEAKNIHVSVQGSTVTLRGKVDSWIERNAVINAAWAAPGVTLVKNEMVVAA